MNKVKFHGCTVGLKSDEGVPMVKPWTVAADDSYVWQAFQDKKCPGPQEHPVHQRVEGKLTKGTEDYAPEMVNMIHRSWKRS
eukprot:12340969-Heterocapsa_arctica.AAC.1